MPLNQQFFAAIRRTLYADHLPQSVVDACNTLHDTAQKYGVINVAQFAYVLATVHGEAGPHMVPVEEIGRGKGKRYGYPGVTLDPKLRIPPDCLHVIYYGRGWPQLTWYDNYLKLEAKLNKPLTTRPDLMLEVAVSAAVTLVGMQYGLFTGHKLSDYFGPGVADWVNARHIINGTDKAQEFAAVGRKFYEALIESNTSLRSDVPVAVEIPGVQPGVLTIQPKPTPVAKQPVPIAPRRGLLADILAWFGKKLG